MKEIALSARSLGLERAEFTLGPIDLDLEAGEFCCLIGRSGSGKTSLFKTLSLLEHPSAGTLSLPGLGAWHAQEALSPKEAARYRRHVGSIPQSLGLWPYHTVLQQVAGGPRLVLGLSRESSEQRAQELLHRLGIGDQASKTPQQISGGQAQRVAIARALAMEPRILLCDEVTAGLDAISTAEVLSLLRAEQHRSGMTVLMATHDLSLLQTGGIRVLVIHEGSLVESATSDDFRVHQSSLAGRQLFEAAFGVSDASADERR